MSENKSFTLIELLIVIGILAILVATVVVVLNPAQLLAQARDSKRQQDLSALSSALNTITALDSSLSLGTSSIVYTSLPDASSTCGSWNLPSLPSGWSYHCSPTTTLQQTNGTGWIPVNFNTTGAVSLASLPLDPQNTSSTGLYYTYVTGGSYELTAAFESTKYKMGGDGDKASTDGGSYPDLYEQGSNLSLQPLDHGDPSLVGYWPLNEGTGTIAYDRSGNNNNGTWYGTSTPHYITSNGKTVGYFNGSSDYVGVNNFGMSSSGATVIFYFSLSDLSVVRRIIEHYWGAGFFSTAFINTNNEVQALFNTPTGQTPAVYFGPFTAGMWHCITMTYDGATFRGYTDGLLSGSVSDGRALKNATTTLLIGSSGSNIFSGSLRNISIYSRALSASEILALYNATR